MKNLPSRYLGAMNEKILQILNHPDLEIPSDFDHHNIAEQLIEFIRLWKKWNDKINLTSEHEGEKIIERHIFDSLQYAKAINPRGKTIDIGSGSGFPGVPIKILYSGLDLTLVESRRKRANFLRELIRTMNWEEISVVHGRAEDLGRKKGYFGKFDVVLFRAVGKLNYCVEIGEPFLKNFGKIIIMKKKDALIYKNLKKMSHIFRLNEEKPVKCFDRVNSVLLIFEKVSTDAIGE